MIYIDTKSLVPIYTQLIYQIKHAILMGEFIPGDELPSVRSLAGDIGINLHTVNKAYKLLADEGIVVKEKKGFKISSTVPAEPNEEYVEQIKQTIYGLLIDASVYNIDIDELIRHGQEDLRLGDMND